MSFKEMERHEFLRLKDLPTEFDVMIHGYREMETKFGFGRYLIAELIQAPKKKQVKGLLKISDTTGWSIGTKVPNHIEHLKELTGYIVSFAFDPTSKTILCTDVKEWGK